MLLRGDLGNQLFQYAVGMHLAQRTGAPLVLNIAGRRSLRDPLGRSMTRKLASFALRARLERIPILPIRLAAGMPGSPWTLYRERRWGFDPQVLDLPDGAVLHGYFQSAAYFTAVAPQVRADLTFVEPWPNKAAQRFADEVAACDSVAVHVRRGDYLRSPLHRVCTLAYYQHAIARMRQHLRTACFFVFSDDMAWCRQHLPLPDGAYVELAQAPGQPVVDLRLMTLCRHHIISNSTFSWWGAWLAEPTGQRVIAPTRWFNDPALDGPAMRDTVPLTWERISVDAPCLHP